MMYKIPTFEDREYSLDELAVLFRNTKKVLRNQIISLVCVFNQSHRWSYKDPVVREKFAKTPNVIYNVSAQPLEGPEWTIKEIISRSIFVGRLGVRVPRCIADEEQRRIIKKDRMKSILVTAAARVNMLARRQRV